MRIIKQSVNLIRPYDIYEVNTGLHYIEYAARNCYDSYDKMIASGRDGFLRSLIAMGHESPLEFMNFMFEIVTSRDVMAQLTRHRVASYSIRSQRYVQDNKHGDIAFIEPEETSEENKRIWRKSLKMAENAYIEMIEGGASPQDARKVSPNSTSTNILMGVNARELRHIIKLRSSSAAYPEMRKLANLLLDSVSHIPVLFEDLVKKEK